MEFAVSHHREDEGDVVVDVAGEIDALNVPKLWDALEPLIENGDGNLVIDLSRVGFIDSTGIGVVIRAMNALKDRGRELSLRGPSPMTYQVFETVGLTKVLSIER
jgi:anti-sigma B factor antagonist